MNVNTPAKRALLCPRCRKLVSAGEAQCPHCGLPAPGSAWRHSVFTSLLADPDRLIHMIIGANGVMYLLALLMSDHRFGLTANPLTMFAPDSRGLLLLGATGTIPIDQYHGWWTLISASYLHGGILHILFNMLALRQIGPLVIHEYGTHRMLAIYTLGGMAGFLVSYVAGVRFTIGASAAVCSLIGAALYFGKSRGGVYGQAVYRQVGGWAMGIVLFGLIVPGINNWAHGGGMAGGMLLGLVMGYEDRRQANQVHRFLGWVCLTGTLAVLGWAIVVSLTPI